MKYGQISRDKNINEFIYFCFQFICEEDQRKFVKKFRKQPHDSDQIMHTFRELILGAYLSSIGFNVRNDFSINTKTPDWCILDDKLEIKGIVELINFHIDRGTENEINKQLESNIFHFFWRDENKNNPDRLYHRILHKADAYNALIKELKKPYVISIFCHFYVHIHLDEIQMLLNNKENGLFEMYPEVSGVLYFQDNSERYIFNYESNPHALEELNLPNGVFELDAS